MADELQFKITAQDQLSGVLANTNDRIRALRKELTQAQAEFVRTGKGADRIEALQTEFDQARVKAAALKREIKTLGSQTNTAGTQMQRAGSKMSSAFSGAAIKVGAAVAGLFAFQRAMTFVKDSIAAYAEAEKFQAELNFAYEKFPKLANVSIDALRDLNQELQDTTGSDADMLASMQATLAMYDITGDQLRDLTPLVNDFAVKTGRDVVTAAQMVGRALMGNTRAMKEVGIDYKMTGSRAVDVANIMELLQQKVEGAAEAFGQTAAGQMQIMQVSMEDMQESVGKSLMPALEVATDGIIALGDSIGDSLESLNEFGSALGDVLGTQAQDAEEGTSILAATIANLPNAINLGGKALDYLAGRLRWLKDVTTEVIVATGTALPGSLDNAQAAFTRTNPAPVEHGLYLLELQADRTAQKMTGLGKALDEADAAIARFQNMRAYEAAMAEFVANPSQEAGEKVVLAMTKAARSMENPEKRARFVQQEVKNIGKAVDSSGLPPKIQSQLTDPLDKANKKAAAILVEFDKLKAFIPNPIDFKVTVNGQPVASMADLAALQYGTAATGGPVDTMKPWLVGEVGPELFVPTVGPMKVIGADGPEFGRFSQPGVVIPNHLVPEVVAAGVSGGSTQNVNVTVNNPAAGIDVEQAVVRAMARAERIKRERG